MSCPTTLGMIYTQRIIGPIDGHYCCRCGTPTLHQERHLSLPILRCRNRSCSHITLAHSPERPAFQCGECVKRSFTQRPAWTCWACGIISPLRLSRSTGLPRSREAQRCVDPRCGYLLDEACVIKWDRHGANVGTNIVDEFDDTEMIMVEVGRKDDSWRKEMGRVEVREVSSVNHGKISRSVVSWLEKVARRWGVPVACGMVVAAWLMG